MSLADELLADLEEIAEEGFIDDPDNDKDEDDVIQDVTMETDTRESSIKSIAKLRDSQKLQSVLTKIKFYQDNPRKGEVMGPVEANPEYQLIVQANNLSVEIENEINIIHKFVRDHYQKRFPELDSLVPNSFEYLSTVKELGNDLERAKNNEKLQEILTNAVIMIVSVSASTTQGTPLTQQELATVFEAGDMAFDLKQAKTDIFTYVESRMSFIAPNLSIIVGASTAAKLMGVAGGLTNLSKMPSCNVLVLGSQRKMLSGFSSSAQLPHTGYIYYSDIVQATPQEMRRQAARLVSAKCTLASRIDSFHESPIGTMGLNLRAEIERKLAKMQEPPPPKQSKALPLPLDQPRKKRGGRRLRKSKDKLGMTEMRKQANRMNFAEIEDDAYQEDLGFSLGQIGKGGSGRVRAAQVDNKTQVKISKSLQRQLHRQQMHGGRSTVRGRETSGTSSSIAFTPLQGLEIVNPHANDFKAQEANDRYFSTISGFQKVKDDAGVN